MLISKGFSPSDFSFLLFFFLDAWSILVYVARKFLFIQVCSRPNRNDKLLCCFYFVQTMAKTSQKLIGETGEIAVSLNSKTSFRERFSPYFFAFILFFFVLFVSIEKFVCAKLRYSDLDSIHWLKRIRGSMDKRFLSMVFFYFVQKFS